MRLRFFGDIPPAGMSGEINPSTAAPIFALWPAGVCAASPFGAEPYGAGTPWPILVSRETAVKWFWRVREWRISVSLTNSSAATYTAEAVVTNHGSDPGVISPPSTPGDELDLPFSVGTEWAANLGADASFTFRQWHGSPLPFNHDPGNPRRLQLWEQIGVVYPALVFTLDYFGTLSTLQAGESYVTIPGVECYIDGEPVTLYWDSAQEDQGYTGSITIAPETFWEYARPDGTEAVVDENSGVKLRDHRIG